MQLDSHATLERGLQKLERCLSTKRGLPVKKDVYKFNKKLYSFEKIQKESYSFKVYLQQNEFYNFRKKLTSLRKHL